MDSPWAICWVLLSSSHTLWNVCELAEAAASASVGSKAAWRSLLMPAIALSCLRSLTSADTWTGLCSLDQKSENQRRLVRVSSSCWKLKQYGDFPCLPMTWIKRHLCQRCWFYPQHCAFLSLARTLRSYVALVSLVLLLYQHQLTSVSSAKNSFWAQACLDWS